MYVDINAAGCPDTCRHCSVDGHMPAGSIFSLEDLRALRNEWGPLTIRYEPTAHPDFPAIFAPDIASEHGGWLVTNGFGLARREDYRGLLDQMCQQGIHTLALTLHGTQEHHDWFVCRLGAYEDILSATRRARQAGFTVHWQVYVDRRGVQGVSRLAELCQEECGEDITLSLPYHRVGGRLRHYEPIRLTLRDAEQYQLDRLVGDPRKNDFAHLETLTAKAWLEQWRQAPADVGTFRHPFEPAAWPPDPGEPISLRIERDRKVYLDPLCSSPIFLGTIADGRESILKRLAQLSHAPCPNLGPEDVVLAPEEAERLHPCGFSLRYAALTRMNLAMRTN
jgi:hypothetical protein